VNGWTWDGCAPGAAVTGVCDDEARARRHAEAWLRDHPSGRVLLVQARLNRGPAVLQPRWEPCEFGERLASRRLPGGRIAWARARAPVA
jgi:hypothetical protein